jgi:hypothetical protein
MLDEAVEFYQTILLGIEKLGGNALGCLRGIPHFDYIRLAMIAAPVDTIGLTGDLAISVVV